MSLVPLPPNGFVSVPPKADPATGVEPDSRSDDVPAFCRSCLRPAPLRSRVLSSPHFARLPSLSLSPLHTTRSQLNLSTLIPLIQPTTTMASSTSQSTGQSIVNTISDAASYVSETVQEYTSGASKEANKEVAKDSNQSIGTRLSAGVDALGDKADESKHSAKAEANKKSAQH
ncbi:hypothetical protein BMF94_1884 [Rhodotorula taiwanensis]|uniref:Uncharacterized protein n=1 Tax=Rhodotorula taiwanensis TaxID=741276 RepID=A0A2S5BDS1_9BASI|nr:hypothetical protein BMF94_1884 [Rhodotorula taiwanensis]